ncbi:MAG: amidohydrolase [Candidatus Cryptobacteroides sp.]|nr:amidohydrolase [Candidatus Cryptobacteroides sp.]
MNILLKNIVCNGTVSDIYIEGSVIARIVTSAGDPCGQIPASGVEVVDCQGKTAMPAFVNMHTHAGMSLMRGIEEDVPLKEWIDRIWEVESHIDGDFVYHATKVACLEMIKSGTVTFNDQYWFPLMARKAAVEMGLRPVISYVVLDHNNKEEAEFQKDECVRTYEESLGWKDGGLFSMAFHAIYSVSEEMMLWSAEFARKHGLKLHIHLSETEKEVRDCMAGHNGLSPVEYLDRLGILGPDVIAAHTLWLSDEDVRILGERKVNCVHNINSNTKLASGYRFRYNELRDAGANVCIGTDGCASSNNLDMLEALKTTALFQKAWRENPKALPLYELISLATRNGADAVGLDTGRLEAGMQADICIVNTDSSFFLSPGSFLSNFIYSAHSDCIDSLISMGRFVMRNRKVEGEERILRDARKELGKIM